MSLTQKYHFRTIPKQSIFNFRTILRFKNLEILETTAMNVEYIRPGLRQVLVTELGKWIQNYTLQQWKCYFVSFTFNPLKGNQTSQIQQMRAAIECFYRTLVGRAVKKPSAIHNQEKLPRFVGFPDLPVFKTKKTPIPNLCINDGLHFHAMVLIPEKSRLTEDLPEHIDLNQDQYLDRIRTIFRPILVKNPEGKNEIDLVDIQIIVKGKLQRIDVQPTTFTPEYQAGYQLKSFTKGRLTYDHLLVLPRASGELPTREDRKRERQAAKEALNNLLQKINSGAWGDLDQWDQDALDERWRQEVKKFGKIRKRRLRW
jgi:hypothetical protein